MEFPHLVMRVTKVLDGYKETPLPHEGSQVTEQVAWRGFVLSILA